MTRLGRARSALRRAGPPVGRWLALIAVSAIGAALGLLIGGHQGADIGPFHAQLALTPSVHRGTEVAIPPLGSLELHSHAGPLHLRVRLEALDEARARAIVADPGGLARADTLVRDLSAGLRALGTRCAGAALLGALLLGALVYRRVARVAA